MDFVTCCHASYIEQHGRPSHPTDIEQQHRIVGYFSSLTGKVFPLRFTRGTENLEIHAQSAVAVNESTAHLTALSIGMGIGQTFAWFVKEMVARGEMVTVLEDWQQPRHPLYIMYPSSRHLNATVRVFVNWAVKLFAAVDDRVTET